MKGTAFFNGRIYTGSLPLQDKAALKEMLQLAAQAVSRYGITSVQTDDYCVFRTIPWQTVNEAYRELEAEGKLCVRVTEQCNFADPASLQAFLEAEKLHEIRVEAVYLGGKRVYG